MTVKSKLDGKRTCHFPRIVLLKWNNCNAKFIAIVVGFVEFTMTAMLLKPQQVEPGWVHGGCEWHLIILLLYVWLRSRLSTDSYRHEEGTKCFDFISIRLSTSSLCTLYTFLFRNFSAPHHRRWLCNGMHRSQRSCNIFNPSMGISCPLNWGRSQNELHPEMHKGKANFQLSCFVIWEQSLGCYSHMNTITRIQSRTRLGQATC